MAKLGEIAARVRSKNAGPFWITVDVFCGTTAVFERLEAGFPTARAAELLGQQGDALKRFSLPELNVIKFSFVRPEVQGSRRDRDMHGAQWAILLAEAEID